MSSSSLLELTHQKLYWPPPEQIWQPSGAGAKVYAKLAQEKIETKIRQELPEAKKAKVGILAANPFGKDTEAPLALVCEFPRPISQETLKEIYRLAWSFSRTRALITVEPQLLRVWSCCEPPEASKTPQPIQEITPSSLSEQAANTLQWVELATGEFFEKNHQRFQRTGAADYKLLENLQEVRKQLTQVGLESKTIHDLLARIIFVQYLFQKKDSKGHPALNSTMIQDLVKIGILSQPYNNLPEILEDFDDTYKLFRWLNDKFNGDLFPGKGQTPTERDQEWQREIDKVKDKSCLKILADFVRGDLEMKKGQFCLWPMYSFDVIPLEFISSIYEEFVSPHTQSKTGVHYTPEFIVDFVLDGVLPWEDDHWDLKILDPACGSGIFLVKAYQRLIYRWEKAYNKNITPDILKALLENNFFGVDIDSEAIRVASFSFYLMMLDHIKPDNYWENDVKLPNLREKRLISADFFRENIVGFRTKEDAATYDLVLGNAPWGKNTITDKAQKWIKQYQWENCVSYGNIAPFFLSKSVYLTKSNGYISMMQPAGALIFNQGKKPQKLRSKLFSEVKLNEIVDLSALRFGLFKNSISPTCIITLQNTPSDDEPILYISPKAVFKGHTSNYSIIVEPHNIHWVQNQEILSDNLVLIALTWGSRRDFHLIKRLSQEKTLNKLKQENIVATRQGITRGNRKKINKELCNRPILEGSEFSQTQSLVFLDADDLSINNDLEIDSYTSIDFTAFNTPQLIVKLSWTKNIGRFQARLTKLSQSKTNTHGILCSGSYVSIHAFNNDELILQAAWLSYNSMLAVYYLFLSSGRFASYRPEIKSTELLNVPIPDVQPDFLNNINSLENVDKKIKKLFEFKESEWALIEDLFNYTLPDFKINTSSLGHQKTTRKSSQMEMDEDEPELSQYCDYFIRVIKDSFGQNKAVCATIFQEPDNQYLPVRLVAIHLNHSIHQGIKIETLDSENLLKRLQTINNSFLQSRNLEEGGIYYQRVARVYDSVRWNNTNVPTVYFIKPDKMRYWTRSMALRDADEVAADIIAAGQQITVNP